MNKIFLSLTTPKTKRTPKQKMKNKLEIVIEEDRVHVSENNFPANIIDIPQISNVDLFESNMEKAYQKGLNHCPCCGKSITNPKYFINSIWGGCAYPSNDQTQYNDAWVMGVGSECRKKFPDGYVFCK